MLPRLALKLYFKCVLGKTKQRDSLGLSFIVPSSEMASQRSRMGAETGSGGNSWAEGSVHTNALG